MSVFNDTWRFLMQRKLWPVAILLIVAAVAVPKLLASEPTAAPVPPAAAVKSDSASVLATEPIVAPAATPTAAVAVRSSARAKNPFKPKATPTPDPEAEARPRRRRRRRPTHGHDRDRARCRRRRRRPARHDPRHHPCAGQEEVRAQRADRALRAQ